VPQRLNLLQLLLALNVKLLLKLALKLGQGVSLFRASSVAS
jgi:hypothetical protein